MDTGAASTATALFSLAWPRTPLLKHRPHDYITLFCGFQASPRRVSGSAGKILDVLHMETFQRLLPDEASWHSSSTAYRESAKPIPDASNDNHILCKPPLDSGAESIM